MCIVHPTHLPKWYYTQQRSHLSVTEDHTTPWYFIHVHHFFLWIPSGSIRKHRQSFSQNFSSDKVMLLRILGNTFSHTPTRLACSMCLLAIGLYQELITERTPYSLSTQFFTTSAPPFCTHALCYTYDSSFRVSSDLLHPNNGLCRPYVVVVGSGTPRPERLVSQGQELHKTLDNLFLSEQLWQEAPPKCLLHIPHEWYDPGNVPL